MFGSRFYGMCYLASCVVLLAELGCSVNPAASGHKTALNPTAGASVTSRELISSNVSGHAISRVWVADNGDGTYKNPILYADYSDPDVIRVGDDYYMTASSFTCIPGLPVLHSRDLVNWTLIGHAVQRYPNDLFDRPQHGKGIWAPAIRYHNNLFYIFWGDPDTGIYRVRAQNPAGPWDEPLLVVPGQGLIDPCPFWDDDGRAYIVHGWAASRTGGFNSVLTLRQMTPDASAVIGQGKHIFDGHETQPTIEGPKLYKRNGYYYIFAPAGGVATGWQTVLRSRQITGPYEEKIVLVQGGTPINGPHQGAWVDTPLREHWFIHFQDCQAYGRVVHLQKLNWIDDWPVIGIDKDGDGKGEPAMTEHKPLIRGLHPITTPQESDEFDSDTLGLQWQWQANPKLTWYCLLPGKTHLRLFAEKLPAERAPLTEAGNLLLQKFPAPSFTATTRVKFTPQWDGKRTGLTIMGEEYASLSITKVRNSFSLVLHTYKPGDENIETVVAEQPLPGDTVYLRVKVTAPKAACQFSYSLDGQQYNDIGGLFWAKPGKWIGAKVGLFCISEPSARNGGYADFDWFRIE